jgi:opacity protein-like surface antigen
MVPKQLRSSGRTCIIQVYRRLFALPRCIALHREKDDMKHIAHGFLAILLVLSMSGIAIGEESPSNTVGLKIWMNRWKSEKPGSERRTSDVSTLVGWTAEMDFSNNVFIEASYLVSVSDYTYSLADVTTDVERNDVDAAAGYLFTPNLGVFAGYRSSQFREKITKNKETLHGPLIGVRGSMLLNDLFSFFGELTYLPRSTKAAFAATDETETDLGWFIKAGVRWVFSRDFSGALGYQYEATKGRDTDSRDTYAGATFELMYSF